MAERDKARLRISASTLRDIDRLAEAYRDGPRRLRTQINKALKTVALEVANEVPGEAAKRLPKGGGLAARIADVRGTISPSLRAASPSVSILFKAAKGERVATKAIDAGSLRHPVFGNRENWVWQPVRPGSFTNAFQKRAPKLRREMEQAISAAVAEIEIDIKT